MNKKKNVFLSTPQSWSTAKAGRLPEGVPRNCLFSVDFKTFDQRFDANLKNPFFAKFCTKIVIFAFFLLFSTKNAKSNYFGVNLKNPFFAKFCTKIVTYCIVLLFSTKNASQNIQQREREKDKKRIIQKERDV